MLAAKVLPAAPKKSNARAYHGAARAARALIWPAQIRAGKALDGPMHPPPTLSRISSRRDFASSPQSTPRASHGEGDTALALGDADDDGKRKGLSSRALTFSQLWLSLLPFSPASPGLPRISSLGSFSAPAASAAAAGAGAAPGACLAPPSAGGAPPSASCSSGAGAGAGGWPRALPSLPFLYTRLPCALALLVFLVTLASWEVAPARHTLDPALPAHIPVLAIPTSPGRGPSLLATLHSLESRVEVLLLCNSAPLVPELQCVLDEVALLAEAGELNIGRVRAITPPRAPGPVYGVAECWNAMVDLAFEDLGAPWVLVMNDDVGLPAGALGAAVEETWRTHQRHSLLLAHEGLPGVGYAFSAFVLTRAGRAALGSFDENFFPAYYEVSAPPALRTLLQPAFGAHPVPLASHTHTHTHTHARTRARAATPWRLPCTGLRLL